MNDTTEDIGAAADAISENGFVICEDEVNGLPCVATAGLQTTFGHPEFVIVGMDPMEAAHILSVFADMVESGERLRSSALAGPPEAPFALVPLRPEALPSFHATYVELLGSLPSVVQIFDADPHGLFPWEDGCDEASAQQMCLPVAEAPPAGPGRRETTREADLVARRDALVGKMRKHVEENGWTLQSVFGSEDTAPFSYTIGLSVTYGHPEVYVCGLQHEIAQQLLASVAARISAGERFDVPVTDAEIANVPTAFRPVRGEEVDENSGIGQEVLGRPFGAVQLFWPDKNGLMPWEDGCDPEIARAQTSMFVAEGDPPTPDAVRPAGSRLH